MLPSRRTNSDSDADNDRMPELVSLADAADRIEQLRRGQHGSLLVAIDGAGGAGKTTRAAGRTAFLGNTLIVCLDDSPQPGVPGWDQTGFPGQGLDPLL